MKKKNIFFLLGIILSIVFIFNNCSKLKDTELSSFGTSKCRATAGVTGSPETSEELVDLINSLPKPVTIPCFLESLDRPLKVVATDSHFSVQPAESSESPRVFIFVNDIIVSVVADGLGGELLEYGILRSNSRTTKAEVKFPVESNLAYSAPFDRIKATGSSGSKCVACHTNEVKDPLFDYTNAFTSKALKPLASTKVYLSEMKEEFEKCISSESLTERCGFFRALFSGGQIEETSFPSEMSTINSNSIF